MADSAVKIPFTEAAAPSTPAASKVVIYAKSDGLMYSKDDAGTETLMSGGAGGGSVATDAIWDAAGDLAVGSGANTAAKLTKGSALQTLRVNSGATNLEWAATLGAWTDFTPTITAGGGGFSLGNGVLQGRYKALDANTYQISIFYQRGSTTSNGTGAYAIALPATAKITKPQVQVLQGYFLDSGTMYYVASGYIINNTASVSTIVIADSGSVREWSTTNPVVPATGDELALSGIIEV
jgi:hypothetical protein